MDLNHRQSIKTKHLPHQQLGTIVEDYMGLCEHSFIMAEQKINTAARLHDLYTF